ncbi:ParB/RepB/Spo0J family partition protein [Verrucomicrobium spinosum]|uniref:ParB/RepB/Spo0J family partition protein n=1 Tax=Verrucomicrobium spinosum TaxID=2736 RepID=UPI0009E684B9|nr:ParB/RepB/Spo0J family partition protein [Verrucomicrobium spinosum]
MIATQSTEAAPAPTRATVVYLPHENLHECILNPRKEFKPGPLEELSKNIEEMGVKQPLLVRPSRTVAGQYEIIAGARRWRGNGMALDRVVNYDDVEQVHRLVAKLGELPCMVEDMSDVQAREFMLVENLQREDLTVVEEADGYADLLALKGEDGQPLYTVAKIAERIGRSESHVTQRLKLRRAPKRLLEACEKGVIGSRHCELVGRIPDVEAREELAKAILAPQMRDKDLPLNVRETVALIRRDYMLSLKGCGFDVDDAELLPVQFSAQGERLCGGACMGCPFRSGNDASLQEELKVVGGQSGGGSMGVDPHVCTKRLASGESKRRRGSWWWPVRRVPGKTCCPSRGRRRCLWRARCGVTASTWTWPRSRALRMWGTTTKTACQSGSRW